MNVVTDDTGEYSCEAVNPFGKDFTHCTVKIVGVFFASESRAGISVVFTRAYTHRCECTDKLVEEVDLNWVYAAFLMICKVFLYRYGQKSDPVVTIKDWSTK